MQELNVKIVKTVKKLYGLEQAVELTVPDESFGDYSTNIAMKLAKELGKNPREIAEAIKDELLSDESIKNIQIAGPGFINFYLTDQSIIESWNLEVPQVYKNKLVIAEYSDPNAFKALHAGHLYTTLVGNAIANII